MRLTLKPCILQQKELCEDGINAVANHANPEAWKVDKESREARRKQRIVRKLAELEEEDILSSAHQV